jgi:fatty-acyl-CoA synthase
MSATDIAADGGNRPAATTLGDLLSETARRWPCRPAVIHGDQSLTFGALDDEVSIAARSLLALDVSRGDRVGLLASNRPEWLVVALAAARVGAVVVPLNTWYRRDELAWALRHTGVAALFSEATFLGHDYAADVSSIDPALAAGEPGQLASSALPHLRSIVFLDERRPGAFGWNEFLGIGKSTEPSDLAIAAAGVQPEDPLFVLYTSGSTADLKGVVLRHRGLVENPWAVGARRRLGPSDRVWLGSPLFYGLGATNALPACLGHGSALVLQGHFRADRAIDAIEAHSCTVFYGTSNMIRQIYEAPGYRRHRVESLERGTAGITPEERRLLISDMGVAGATQSYGLTEVYGNCFGGYPDDDLEVKLNTCGNPLPGFEFRVVEPSTGRPVERGEAGLLMVRGYTTDGYYQNPEETAQAITPDGWFNTGDLGRFDASGRFQVTGRLKEMVKTGGINVSPLEVEHLLLRHPDIREAYVVGVPDPAQGEVLVAFVSTTRPLTEQNVREYTRSAAASFKTPAHVIFRNEDEIPRTPSGKVPRFKLREEAIAEFVGGGHPTSAGGRS